MVIVAVGVRSAVNAASALSRTINRKRIRMKCRKYGVLVALSGGLLVAVLALHFQ